MKEFVSPKMWAAAIMAAVVCPTTFAAAAMPADDGIMPCYEIASSASSTLSFSGSTATCTSRCTGASAVSITAVQTLQKEGLFWIWGDVDDAEWTKTVNVATIGMTNTKSGLESGTYRVKTEFTLTNSDGETETITIYSTEKDL